MDIKSAISVGEVEEFCFVFVLLKKKNSEM